MKSFIGLIFAVLTFAPTVFAQEDYQVDLINSGQLLDKGIEAYEKKEYKRAIQYFEQITRNDTNYVFALSELGITYFADSQFTEAVRVVELALVEPKGKEYNLYVTLGSAYDGLKEYDKALQAYQKGLTYAPYDYSLWFNSGIVYEHKEEKEKATNAYKKALQYNPFHSASLNAMGRIELEKGHTVTAMMAFYMSLICNPNGNYKLRNINGLDDISNVKVALSNGSSSRKADNFYEIELMIASKIALSPKYKNTAKIDDAIIKQAQLMIDQLQYNAADTGYFMQRYVPYFIKIREDKYYIPFIFQAFAGINIADIQKGEKKYASDISAFKIWTFNYWDDVRSTQTVIRNGLSTTKTFTYYTTNQVASIGDYKDRKATERVHINDWVYFYVNGYKKMEGNFNQEGQKTGEWKSYDYTGPVNEISSYKNGVIEGKFEKYFTNGQLYYTCNTVNGHAEGVIKVYDEAGNLKREKGMKLGEQDGITKEYFLNGRLKSDLVLENGEFQGLQKKYYTNGAVSKLLYYTDGKINGEYKEYYDNGVLLKKGSYTMDVKTGVWMQYHDNKKVLDSGAYNSQGNVIGKWVSYHSNGALERVSQYDIKGKKQGIHNEYDTDGILYSTYTFTEGSMTEYAFFNKSGTIVSSGKEKGNVLTLKSFYPDGKTLRSEGMYKNGVEEGEWRFYHANNYLSSVEKYVNGEVNGILTTYYSSGLVEKEITYKDGMREGLCKTFYSNRKPHKTGNYIQDEKQGYWITYWPNGKVHSLNYYLNDVSYGYTIDYTVNGVKYEEDLYEFGFLKQRSIYDTSGKVIYTTKLVKGSGECKTVYSNGKLRMSTAFKNCEWDGPLVRYYSNGKVREKSTYVKGNAEGNLVVYEEDGSLAVTGAYKDDKRIGKWTYYNPNGNVESSGYYKNGSKDSIWISYDEKGHKTDQVYWLKGDLNGITTYYSPDTDERILVRTFVEDYVKNYAYMSKDYTLINPIPIINETVDYKTYYHTGTPALQFSVKGGFREGSYISYYSDGKKCEEFNYLTSDKNGRQIVYYPTGTIQIDDMYLLGEKDGECKAYYPNGILKSSEHYVFGVLHGSCNYYDQQGTLKKTIIYSDGIPSTTL